MRIWSLHPRYLDAKGLVALWREGLLAQAVLLGQTRGYTQHPQLQRFKQSSAPADYIAAYLLNVWEEATARGYRFDRTKLPDAPPLPPLPVTDGQLAHEWRHLLQKLTVRAPDCRRQWRATVLPAPHPLFHPVPGEIAGWEILSPKRTTARRTNP